jgi:uncharacterized membrane protein
MGDSFPRLSYKYSDSGLYFVKIIYEIIMFVFINLILVNIFFGVIVDSFNEMRDETTKEKEDITNKCFMCNSDRFDKKDEDFDSHRENIHYVFDYLYVYLFLANKNQQEFTAIESYVWKQIRKHESDWLPKDQSKDEDDK